MPVICPSPFSEDDLRALAAAKRKLENPSLAARVSSILGRPIEAGFKRLPKAVHNAVAASAEIALRKGLEFSMLTLGRNPARRSQRWVHRAVAVGTGAAGGAFGTAALAVELPVSTCIMLRSIADIARREGHDLTRPEVRLACLEVFALGGKAPEDNAAESGYWVVRGALAGYLSEAANHLAQKGLTDRSAPVLMRLIAKLAARFSIVVTEEAALKAVPVVGAVSGGAINYVFMQHFQEMAEGHFVIKRLEKTYGTQVVREMYYSLP